MNNDSSKRIKVVLITAAAAFIAYAGMRILTKRESIAEAVEKTVEKVVAIPEKAAEKIVKDEVKPPKKSSNKVYHLVGTGSFYKSKNQAKKRASSISKMSGHDVEIQEVIHSSTPKKQKAKMQGFKTFLEASEKSKEVENNGNVILGFGYNKRDKHFFEYEQKPMNKSDEIQEVCPIQPTKKKIKIIKKTMTKFKQGKLKTPAGKKVTKKKQAVAIAMTKAGQENHSFTKLMSGNGQKMTDDEKLSIGNEIKSELEKKDIKCHVELKKAAMKVKDFRLIKARNISGTGRKLNILNWNDWVTVNNTINEVLDKHKISANVSTLGGKFVVRSGSVSMKEADWEHLASENVGSMVNPLTRADAYPRAE